VRERCSGCSSCLARVSQVGRGCWAAGRGHLAVVIQHNCSNVSRIDIARESVVTFKEAARIVGRLKGTKAVPFQTLFRWATKGCSRVVLESVFVGGVRCTSKEALQRFFDGVTRARASATAVEAIPMRSATAPVAEIGDVDGILRRAGILGAGEEVQP